MAPFPEFRLKPSPDAGPLRAAIDPKQRIERSRSSLTDAVPDRYRGLITLAAGIGVCQGEAFGLGH